MQHSGVILFPSIYSDNQHIITHLYPAREAVQSLALLVTTLLTSTGTFLHLRTIITEHFSPNTWVISTQSISICCHFFKTYILARKKLLLTSCTLKANEMSSNRDRKLKSWHKVNNITYVEFNPGNCNAVTWLVIVVYDAIGRDEHVHFWALSRKTHTRA